jgi:hypothetical protein
MINPIWKNEADRYRTMDRREQELWLAQLSYSLTLFARSTYTVGEEGLDDPKRMRRFNELMHRTADQLTQHLQGSPGRPDEVFLNMVDDEIGPLGVDASDLIGTLTPKRSRKP